MSLDPAVPAAPPEDRSIAMGWAALLGLLLAAPIAAGLVTLHVRLRGRAAIGAALDGLLGQLPLGLAALAVGIVAHELVHAAVWVRAGQGDWSRVRFGWSWKGLAPFAHYTEPLPATAYRIGAVAPLVLLGILPAVLGTLGGWDAIAAFGWVLVVGAAGDLAVLWLLRGVPARALVADHPTRAGCLVYPARPPG